METKETALIDCDFLMKISEVRKNPIEINNLIRRAFDGASIDVMIHELVKANELMVNSCSDVVKYIFSCNTISTLLIKDILLDDNKKKYYDYCIRQMFFQVHHRAFPSDNIFTWYSQSSLGEMHSIAACLVGDFSIFLSDDSDSSKIYRLIKENGAIDSVKIYNRKDFFDDILPSGVLNSKERHMFKHKS